MGQLVVGNVEALVRWANGKRLTDRLPKLSLIALSRPGTAGYSGPDRIYGSTCHQQLAFLISGDPGRVIFQVRQGEVQLF